MFGRNSDDDTTQQDDVVHDVSAAQPLSDDQTSTPISDQPWQHPGEPIESPTSLTLPPEASHHAEPTIEESTIGDAPSPTAPAITPLAQPDSTNPDPAAVNYDLVDLTADELIDIKQKALGQLNPLMEHLDQTPEEKFRTTMMMIQASDDQKLVPIAYDAAQKITDEKARAQALLDIVNEINYFTQHHNS